mmetsp:Transcript_31819/g.90376  ORF Transcript_31819/g.90376 Transcript_31819/m.90376 type:complete len:930 (-) Transcript_31819:498-3287(-)|eukprot:CAMPEP_0117664750 /NCGR_PEP_ID=MMETSP0804-20121206/9405_1 /TAXON_ID=1074897 /ORGANISM="Tetraselmis astigmatica, Strain CCMP880" /LENGTH=929 /DNA_ID=CAMNT_0005472041 /DNA_START=462 /DNA_END=3251 /DNA_ORIENTATION=-
MAACAMGAVPVRSAIAGGVRTTGFRRNSRTPAVAARSGAANPSPVLCGSRMSSAWGSRLSLSAAFSASQRRMAGSRGFQPVRAVFEKFTERAIKAVMLAQQEAKNLGVLEVTAQHILLGLIAEGSTKDEYMGSGITLDAARQVVESMSSKRKKRDVKELPFSRDSKRVFEAALTESRRLGMNFIAPEHIIIACLTLVDSGARAVVMRMDADVNAIKAEAIRRLKGEQETPQKKRKSPSRKKQEAKVTDEYCRDLNKDVKKGKTDPIFGREKEVQRMAQILARRTKNNPILLGEPGVGKTAIAEGLAYAIVRGTHSNGDPVPEFLLNKRILSLDVGLLVAGAKERGELESRVTKLIAECKADPGIILMIDEIHTLVGAGAVGRGGGGGGGLDISNLMKPALARGELQCIGATTLDEHRKYVEKDAALERRFQPIMVDESTTADTLLILSGLKEAYEVHHRCTYSSDALVAAVNLSHRYIADRQLPDKAIDLIDEAGSRARINAYLSRKTIDDSSTDEWDIMLSQAEELKQVLKAKSDAIGDGLYEEAALLFKRETELKQQLRSCKEDYMPLPEVTASDIESVVSAWTGIPVERMNEGEVDKLANLDQALQERVVGQENAVAAIARAMRRNCSGLKDPNRPIGGFLFCGPTGVGKTEVTKALADLYFGDANSMIRLDMSEYMERHSVSKLVGAPPGYVGHGEGGKLTEAVRRKPFSIILLDEVEKAHPDIFNILLQVLEEGRLTDSQGRTVSFKNTLIIMTSNIGSSVISKGGSSLGFQMPTDDPDGGKYERIRSLVLEEIKSYFRPEMLNRLDEIVVFHQLNKEQIRTIADMVLAETAERLADRGVALQVTEKAMNVIIEQGFDEAYGARPLRRAVTSLVDDCLSDLLLTNAVGEGDVVTVDAKDGEVYAVLPSEVQSELLQVVYSSTMR